VRYEIYLLAAGILITLAVVVPAARSHGLVAALAALLCIVAILGAGLALLVVSGWLLERAQGPKSAWGTVLAGLGHLLRFGLCALVASLLASALVAWHGLSLPAENRVALVSGILGGAAGVWLHLRLGSARFWTAFGRLALALLASFLLGILGILGPGNWGVDLGILAPLLVFGFLAAAGRIVPPPEGGRPSPG
jgi:hypothetical protein